MANDIVSRLGQKDGSGDTDALFLKVFSGEVLTSFENKTVTMDKHLVRTIEHGKSSSFPVLGRSTAAYHKPGQEISGDAVEANERLIYINDLLLTAKDIAEIDELKNHYDVRSIYANEMGIALANQMDKHVLQTIVQAATDPTPKPSSATDRVGTVITNSDLSGTAMESDADDLIEAIFAVAEEFDEKNVPDEDRYVFVKPKQYYLLANSSSVQNRDFGNDNGSPSSGKVFNVADMTIVKTNNLPTANITSGADAGDDHARQAVDASNTVFLAAHPSAVGTLKLMDLATEMEWQQRYQVTQLIAKYAVGHGKLRPEAAAQGKTS